MNYHDQSFHDNEKQTEAYWRANAIEGSNKLLIRLKAQFIYEPKHPVKREPALSCTRNPTVRDIQDRVCEFYHVKRADLLGHRRSRDIVIPRHIAVYIAFELTDFSTLQLGRFFGGKDHATMINSVRRIKAGILKDADLAFDIAALIEDITGVQQ